MKRNIRGWKTEHKEHPWATIAQAKQIAADHNEIKKRKR